MGFFLEQANETSSLRATWSSIASQSTQAPPDKGREMRKVTSAEALLTSSASPTARAAQREQQGNGLETMRASASNASLSSRSNRVAGGPLN